MVARKPPESKKARMFKVQMLVDETDPKAGYEVHQFREPAVTDHTK